jgi:hypothetical protein
MDVPSITCRASPNETRVLSAAPAPGTAAEAVQVAEVEHEGLLPGAAAADLVVAEARGEERGLVVRGGGGVLGDAGPRGELPRRLERRLPSLPLMARDLFSWCAKREREDKGEDRRRTDERRRRMNEP